MKRSILTALACAALLMVAACKPAPDRALDPVGEALMDREHAACLRSGGEFLRLGKANQFFCQKAPSDAGKSCSRASDCESACLARSRSCAPVKPLFGCNEVLNDFGGPVTQCID